MNFFKTHIKVFKIMASMLFFFVLIASTKEDRTDAGKTVILPNGDTATVINKNFWTGKTLVQPKKGGQIVCL